MFGMAEKRSKRQRFWIRGSAASGFTGRDCRGGASAYYQAARRRQKNPRKTDAAAAQSWAFLSAE